WLTQTTAAQNTYTGVLGHTYGFYSIARDLTGNVEPAKTSAEATTTVSSPATTTTTNNVSVIFSPTPQTITLTATVTSASGPVNGGTVAFSSLNMTVSGVVVNGNTSANFTNPGGTAV